MREALGYTQAELAERMGVTRATVANWESGRAPCSGTAAILLTALSMPKEDDANAETKK